MTGKTDVRAFKSNPNSLSKQLSLKTSQGESKENTPRNPG
jgi:hypothetical protein